MFEALGRGGDSGITVNCEGGSGMKTLRQARIGDTVTVVKLHGEGAVKRRIMDMGLTKGTQVHVRK